MSNNYAQLTVRTQTKKKFLDCVEKIKDYEKLRNMHVSHDYALDWMCDLAEDWIDRS